MSEQPRILVVDDDSDVRWMLRRYLGKHGFAVEVSEDGLSLARLFREHHSMAIIMLTAASEVVDRVSGLEVGADDYFASGS